MKQLARLAAGLALAALSAPVAAQDLDLGREVFLTKAQPNCGICHVLADAGTSGNVGPSLDELAPDEAQVRAAVASGVGVMPAFSGTLSDDEIAAVSAYVASVAGGS